MTGEKTWGDRTYYRWMVDWLLAHPDAGEPRAERLASANDACLIRFPDKFNEIWEASILLRINSRGALPR